ncbi:glycerophosphodiester phosphodiesterase [Sulfitobacter sp. EhC04]|uniref:glycerophosphodiester phosphodiesterase family protein n=1 Tax=Sulfitobacter sp. EhC04 TaxID=1849168 RepID=UPI0007F41CCC|nr:glycerophosphodiester phosphodiesterase family protein [Sulfitobacter sp. EhC04]OAN76155.1 glycerophosphodiester phosphodiesterase [Sulfitobacter sp. EhC04]
MRSLAALAAFSLIPLAAWAEDHLGANGYGYGPRPAFLISRLAEGDLKSRLTSCLGQQAEPTLFSIGHRGAPMMFPEHTVQSNVAAAGMGAGILECDVTFTADHELVCRHAQNDLHTTTNILTTDLAAKCTTGFTPATADTPASAECRTSDLTLAEFRSLAPKMDSADTSATTPEAYQGGVAGWRTDLYTAGSQTMTHAESIALFASLGARFTPELKSPAVEMPHEGFTQADYAQKMIDDYKAAGVPASDVWAQSFNLDDVIYWIANEPAFGAQAVYLVEWSDGFDEQNPDSWSQDFAGLKAAGVNYIGASLNMLLTNADGTLAASDYARSAREAGITLIAWTLERSGPLASGGGWYFRSVNDIITDDSDYLVALDVLAQDVKVAGVFSDWPATVTFYANCMGL